MYKNNLNEKGYLHVKDVIDQSLCSFLTSYLLFNSQVFKKEDTQVLNSHVESHNHLLDTLLECLWVHIENIVEEKLIPTYAYSRLYQNGNILEKHRDREACEISMTLQLGRSHHYAWPIYINNKRFDLAEGDGLIYKGCDVDHWREKCDGPENYYSGQIFLHYVRENGVYKEHAGDKRWEKHPFIRNRNFLMNNK